MKLQTVLLILILEVMKKSKTQLIRVYNSLLEKPKTMKMVDVDIGIERAYICWAVKKLREQGRLQVFETKLCEITKHSAGYLTTDSELFKKSNQYSLFVQ